MEMLHKALLIVFGSFGLWYIVGASSISVLWLRFIRTSDVSPEGLAKAKEEKKVGQLLLIAAKAWINGMVSCPWCFGFWEGLIIGLVVWHSMLLALVLGCAVCATNGLLASFSRM